MFQQFLNVTQEKHLHDEFLFKSEIDLVRPILQDVSFRKSFDKWMKELQKVRNEGPAINGIDAEKVQINILSKIRKCKNILEKYHFCNRSLIHLHPCMKGFRTVTSKIYYERANILMKTENYYEALQSLLMMDTDANEIKVLYRKALCGYKLNDCRILEEHLSQLRNLYKSFDTSPDNVKEELEKYRPEYEKLLKKDVFSSPVENNENDQNFLQKYKDLSIKITPEKGRHIISDELIEDTNNILTEKAFAFVPLRPCFTSSDKNFNTFDCQNCAKTNIVPILCVKCNHAVYCSLDCVHRHQKIHLYECRGHQLWLWHEIGIAYLALRTLLEGFDQFKQLLDENFDGKDLKQILERSVEVEFSPEREQYRLLLSLQTHFEDMSQGDLVTFALTACALTLYLRTESNFFQEKGLLQEYEKWEILASSIILRHIGQMVCNAHTMSDTRVEFNGESLPLFNKFSILNLQRIGIVIRSDETFAAIFPFISLLNHSCKPNISNRFNGLRLTINAKGKIRETEEIFNSYGINYLRISKNDRQAALRGQYHFDCECEECIKPEDEFLSLQKLRCINCKNLLEATFDMESMEVTPKHEQKCSKCGMCFDVEQFNWMIRKVSENIEEIRDQKTLKTVLTALKYCMKCVHPNHEVIYFFCKSLINSVGDFDPTFQSDMEMIAENMFNICEYLYGNNSIEILLDKVCAVRVLPKDDEEIFKLAGNVLSDQGLEIFKNIYKIIVKK